MARITSSQDHPGWILPTIIFSQFAGTSLWFAGNAVLGDLQRRWGLPADALGYMTSAVQLGFITGTLVFAVLAISDRWSPRIVFCTCSMLGALANLVDAELGVVYLVSKHTLYFGTAVLTYKD